MAAAKKLTDMEAIRIVQWMMSDYFFEISECVAIMDPVIRRQMIDQVTEKLNKDTKCGRNVKSHISETLKIIEVILQAFTLTPTGVYMGTLQAFLLSWSEDLKIRGEHRGPRLERTLQKCEFYLELPHFYNYIKSMTKSVLNIINIELKLIAVSTQNDLITIIIPPEEFLRELTVLEILVYPVL